jgi:hypothetical protein
MDDAWGYSVIYDHNTSPTGYYVVAGYDYSDSDDDDKGFFISHIKDATGTVSWEAVPSDDFDY